MPTVTVAVPFHLDENAPYLISCLQSIKEQRLDGPSGPIHVSVHVVSDAKTRPSGVLIEEGLAREVTWAPPLNTFAKKVNFAFKQRPADYYLIASDDVILCRDALIEMIRAHVLVKAAQPPGAEGEVIVNCDSNLEDVAWLTNPCIDPGVAALDPESLHRIRRYQPQGFRHLIRPPRIAFYSTLIPREVWERVGDLDENYVNGWEDTDYCLRCRRNNVVPVITPNAFIYHHGEKTRGKPGEGAPSSNEAYYYQKWADEPCASGLAML